MANKFEQELNNVLKQEVKCPNAFTNAVHDFSEGRSDKKMNIFYFRKRLVVAVCIMILCISSVFAGAAAIKSLIASLEDPAVNKALDYDYIQNVDTQYISNGKGSITEKGGRGIYGNAPKDRGNGNNDFSVKIDSLVMDNSNLAIVFNYKFKTKPESFDEIRLGGLKIEDEMGNILAYAEEYSCSLYEESIGFHQRTSGIPFGGTKWFDSICTSKYAIEEDNTVKQVMFFKSHDNYPKNQKINISFDSVLLLSVTGITGPVDGVISQSISSPEENIQLDEREINCSRLIIYEGDWSYKIDVSDKFFKRESIRYTAEKNDYCDIEKAILRPTGFDIEYKWKNTADDYTISSVKLCKSTGEELYDFEKASFFYAGRIWRDNKYSQGESYADILSRAFDNNSIGIGYAANGLLGHILPISIFDAQDSYLIRFEKTHKKTQEKTIEMIKLTEK